MAILTRAVRREYELYEYTYYTVFRKTPTYVFDYNSGVSWSILIIFIPLKTEMNTLQFISLIP